MSPKLRVLPLLLLIVLALSVPALAQDAMPAAETMSSDGMMTYAADSCNYGGELKSLQAVDAQTVTFELCYPDPALPSKVAFSAFAIHSSDQIMSDRRWWCRTAAKSDRHRSLEV